MHVDNKKRVMVTSYACHTLPALVHPNENGWKGSKIDKEGARPQQSDGEEW